MAATEEELEARIVALEAQQAVQTEALRELVEGNWSGENMPHAAAHIAALYGPEGPGEDFAPVDYPPKD